MRKLSDVLRRICALALCLCMMAQYMPMAGFAEEGTEAAQAVEETTEPTEATTEPMEATTAPMEATTAPTEETTEPTEETTVPTEETTEPAEATEATEAETAGKVITAWTWVEPEEEEDRILDPVTGEVYLSTTQEDPIPMELLTAALPAAILARVEDAEETVTLGPWTCEGYPAEGAYAGDYTFVTTLPEGYTLAEGVAALEVTVRFEEPEMLAVGTVNNEEELRNALQSGGDITVGADIEVAEPITISGQNITLDLNEKTITTSASSLFTISDGATVTVQNGTLKGAENNESRCFNVEGNLRIENVNIQGFKYAGAGIFVYPSGVCTMMSGNISGNSAMGYNDGGGVYVNGGSFTMTDGTISNNNASGGCGGGVYVNGGSFTMNGGTISGNQAWSGGGVRVNHGDFTMTGGIISGNNATWGGGVYVFRNDWNPNEPFGSFTMKDGTISDNESGDGGGGVYADGSFTMTGGSVTGNRAGEKGNGVRIGRDANCTLSGTAKIKGNTGNGTGNLYILTGSQNASRSINGLEAELKIYCQETGNKVANCDQGSFGRLTCENPGCKFTLKNSNELWLEENKMKIEKAPAPKTGLTYDGSSHELVGAGTAETGGTMLYAVALSGSPQPQKTDFSEELPSKTDAGKYTVWYYVPGVGDKADSDMGHLEVTIAKKTLNVNWRRKILTYNGHPQQPTAELVGKVPSDAVYLKISNEQIHAGTYTTGALTLSGGRSGNYVLADDVQGTEFTILPVPLTITAKPKTITYGDAPDNGGVICDGFVPGDDGDFLGGDLAYTYTYEQYDGVGRYTITPGGLTSENYDITFVNGPLYVDPKTISINWGETTRTYDGNPWGPTPTAGGMVNGDKLTLTFDGEGTDVGSYTATVTGIQGEKAENYKLPDDPTTSYTITPADAQFTPPTPKEGLIYSGVTQDLIVPGSSDDGTFQYWLDGQEPSTEIPKGTNAGSYTVHYQLIGDKNHEDSTAGKIDVEIAPKDIKGATVTLGTELTYNGQQQTQGIASVKVDGLKVTYDVTDNTGTNAGNYKMTLTGTGNFTGTKEVPWSIGKKDIADAKITLCASPTYNGKTQIQEIFSVTADGVYAEITYTVTGNIGTDAGTYTMTLTGTGNFTGEARATWKIQAADNGWIEEPAVTGCTYGDTPTVHAGRPRFSTVTVEYFRSGQSLGSTVPKDAGSYQAVFTVAGSSNFKVLTKTVNFTISKRPLTVTAKPKTITYGEKPANDGVIYDGFVNGEDEKALKGTLDFDYDYKQYDKVGSYTITPKGLTSGNYDITFTEGILTVEQKDVTIQDVAVEASKVYDGTTVAAITHNGRLSANFDGENLTFHVGTAAYDDKNAGEDKTVTFTGFSLEGSAAGNYHLTGQPGEVTASIAPMPVALTATVQDKTYDGTLTAELGTVTHSGFVAGDDVQLVNGTPSFSSGDKGENIQVTFTQFALTGKDAGNYALIQPTGVKARISPRPVTVSGITAQDKTYDGNTQVTFAYGDARLKGNVDGEKLTVTAEGSFEDANVGDHKRVNITGLTLEGEKQGNYVLAESGQQTSATAAITPNDRYLDLSGLDLGGDQGTVWIDGEKEPINTSGGRHILLSKEAGLLTTYTYKQNDSGDDYPVGMRVYRFHRKDTGVTLEEITEFENLLNYAGCSIRLSGKKGIRMITGISQTKRSALKSAQGLAGYTLEEYGTVVMRGVGTPTLENSQKHNYAYKKGKADPIFRKADGMIQYTNVLVGFSLDACKNTLTLRPYIILKDTATGETVTLYGGCVCRSIYQVAQQNENTYRPGTAGYKYIHEILNYTTTAEQGGETK